MLSKKFLLGSVIAALTACGGQDALDLGPENPDYGKEPPPSDEQPEPELEYTWDFETEEQLDDWVTGTNAAGDDPSNCGLATELDLHWQTSALQIAPLEGWAEDDQQLCAMGYLSEPVAMEGGTIHISIYLPDYFTNQNPWNTEADDGAEDDRFNFGLQIPLEDANGARANAAPWKNVYEVLGSSFNEQGYGYSQRKADPVAGDVAGRWFDLAFPASGIVDADEGFDVNALVGVGITLTADDVNTDLPGDDVFGNTKYVFVDSVLLEPAGDDYVPPPEPFPAQEPAAFSLPVYTKGSLQSGFSDWGGWGGTYSSAESYELVFEEGSLGSAQWAAPETGVDASEYRNFHFSAFGAEGSGTTSLRVSLCDCETEDDIYVDVTEGEWTEFSIPVADFPDATLDVIRFRSGQEAATTIYIDNVGFDEIVAPQPKFTFAKPVYFDTEHEASFAEWAAGWGGTFDFASTAQVKNGTSSIEAVYNAGEFGALQFSPTSAGADLTDLSTFHFSAYGAEGNGDVSLLVNLCNCEDDAGGIVVTVPEGEWTDFTLNIADFPDISMAELRLRVWQEAAATVYFDNIGFDKESAGIPAFAAPVYYDDLPERAMIEWEGGWGGAYDFGSTEMPQDGDSSIKAIFEPASWGAVQFGPSADVELEGMSTFHFSAYPAEGSGEVQLLVKLCGCDDDAEGVAVTAPEGTWTDFTIDLADFPNISMDEMRIKLLQEAGATVYFDNIGFDQYELGTPRLSKPFYYDEAPEVNAVEWPGGWGGVFEFDSTEMPQTGSTSIKAVYNTGEWGAVQFGPTTEGADLSDVSTFHFSAYGAEGNGDVPLLINLCNCEDDAGGVTVTLPEGIWTDFTIDLADFPDTGMQELRLRSFRDEGATIYFDNIGFN